MGISFVQNKLCLLLRFEFIRIGCHKALRTHVSKNDEFPWSGILGPRREVLRQGMLELAERGKGGIILNGYEHRLCRCASCYIVALPFTIYVI